MKKLLVIVSCLIINGASAAPLYHNSKPAPDPFGVTCCCQTARGGSCCAEVAICGGFIPGCFCR